MLDQAVFRFEQNALEVIPGERVELNPDGQTALQFWQQIAWLTQMECAAGDEQNMVRFDGAVLCRHGCSFNQRQQITLHAFTADGAAAIVVADANFVDLVQKDDAMVLG